MLYFQCLFSEYLARSVVTPTGSTRCLHFREHELHRQSWEARKRYLLACNESYGSAIKVPGIPDVLIILCRDRDTEFRLVLLPRSSQHSRARARARDTSLIFGGGKDKLIFSEA